MEAKKIGIASDHAGYEMKEFLIGYLESKGYEVPKVSIIPIRPIPSHAPSRRANCPWASHSAAAATASP